MIPAAPIWSEFQTPEYPRLSGGTLRTDVAVIGGGLAGLSAAYHLLGRLPGARLVVLEARRIGAGASMSRDSSRPSAGVRTTAAKSPAPSTQCLYGVELYSSAASWRLQQATAAGCVRTKVFKRLV